MTVIPLLLEDSRRMLEGWGDSGVLDPFKKIYEVRVPVSNVVLSAFPIKTLPIAHVPNDCSKPVVHRNIG